MLLGVFLYLLLAVPVSALLLFPPVRDWAFATTRRWWAQGCVAGTGWTRHWSGRSARARLGLLAGARRCAQALRRQAWSLGATLCVLLLLPLGAWTLRGWMPVDGRGDPVSREVDERVAALLHGEHLVPPPPLPPAVFMTAEVEAWRPMARHASRQWELLDPDFRQRLLLVFKLVRERHGYDMVLVEGYRSPERQAALAALGPSVTRAGPFESYHQHGLAADCAFLRAGKVVISERDPWAMRGYALYGEVARSLGLTWGGDWRSPKDYGHVEWRRGRH